MQDWNVVLAKSLKSKNEKMHQKAVEDATAFIGTLESIEPLIVSILDGAIQYDDEDIFVTNTFKNISIKEKTVGRQVLILPLDGLDSVALVDIII